MFNSHPNRCTLPEASTWMDRSRRPQATEPIRHARGVFARAGLAIKFTVFAAFLLAAGAGRAQSPVISDIGATAPTPGPDDQYQLSSGSGNPDGLNYYFDNSSPPGQTFTTGTNTAGYILSTLSVATAGGSGQLPAGGQSYVLRIYQINNGTNASLAATYTSQGGFTFTDDDWLQWTNLGAPLLPNTQYAYSLHRSTAGWENMGNVAGNPYAGGEVALIPPGGGTVTFGSSHGYDAAFDVGLAQVTALQAGAPTYSPSSAVTIGTQVTASSTIVGPGPLTYQWLTDGGGGGTLTNIPGATVASLFLNTSNFTTGFYQYALVVSNNTSAVTSAPSILVVSPVVVATAAALADKGGNITSGIYDISQLTGNSGGSYDGLNYYDDDGANHDGWVGQTFTTGTNAQGYYLNSVALQTGGGGYNAVATLQPYHLYIFQIGDSEAATIAHYTNASFSFTYGDWLLWSGFSLVLKPNTTYAYGFGRDSTGTGWAGLNSSATNTDLYSGGQICSIPAEGGQVTYGASGNEDAVFDIGLLAIGVGASPLPFAQPIAVSPAQVSVAGTPLTLTESTTNGVAPLHYQWLTDGGSGGTLTNIPSSNGTNISVNTTGWLPGVYRYRVIVQNTFGSSTSAVSSVTLLYANANAIMTDMGVSLPAPLPGDISQLSPASGANSPDGLNYYFDNATPPGQTFTTGSNPSGYTLTSLSIDLAGNSGSLPANGQTYTLRIYSISGSQSVLYAVYTSQTNTFGTSDWLRWSSFAVPLAANSTYAYSLGRSGTGSGWDNLANVAGNPYSGGEVALLPANGGTVTYGSSHNFDATFDVGLAVPGYPAVAPALFSPSNSIYAGTPVTASASASGTGTLTYQWQTDGGSGGALTNIPGATSSTLAINTTGMDGLTVAYSLVVGNGSGFTTNETSVLAVQPGSAPIVQTDISPATVSAFPGASVTFGATFAGTFPMTNQWLVDKGTGPTNIVGQNRTTLTLNNLQLSDAGTYSLMASNSLGNNTSSGGVLTVNPNPTTNFTVNFQWISTQSGNNVGTYSGPGIPGYGTGTYWNPINGPSANNGSATYTSSTGFDDSGVNNIGVSLSVTTPESWDWSSTPVIALLDSAVTARSALPFWFSLPNGRYNIVIFSCDGTESTNADAGAQITLEGVTQTALPTQDTSFVQGNNYVVFSGIVVTNASLTGTIAPVAGKAFGSLNGAQVQYLGPNLVLQLAPATGGTFKLQWSAGTLLEATNVTGPWTTNSAASPYTVTPTAPLKFYRLTYP